MEKFYSENEKKDLSINLMIFLVLIGLTVFYMVFVDGDNNSFKSSNSEVVDLSKIEYGVQDGPLEGKRVNNNTDNNSEEDFVFAINKKIILKNSDSLADFKIENPITNRYNFYVEMKLKDTDTLIYKSPVLEPDKHIQQDYLIEKLDKGSYIAVATIFVIDPETQEVVAQTDNNIEIKIRK